MNSRFALLCVAVLLFVGTAATGQDSAEKDVRKAMEDNFAAIIHKDAAALNRQYTDDYFRISETGRVSGKSETIANFINPDFEITKLEPSDVKIRVNGNVAVVTELVSSTGGSKGKTPTEHASRQTVVWVKQHDVWQKHVLQMTSTTPIPESAYTH
jgi:ketosteroid isomerase-like protein